MMNINYFKAKFISKYSAINVIIKLDFVFEHSKVSVTYCLFIYVFILNKHLKNRNQVSEQKNKVLDILKEKPFLSYN